MEQMKLTDDVLRSAFQSLSDELIEEWEKGVGKKHKFSKRFERRMKSLIRKEKNRELFVELRGYLKPATIFATAVVMIFVMLITNSMTVRANPMLLFKKIEIILNDSEMYIYDEDLSNYRFYPYEPTYIPKGYTEIERRITDNSLNIYYENEQGERISWSQILVKSTTIIGINTECIEKRELEYAGEFMDVYIMENGSKVLYYESGCCVFTMNCDNLSVDDMYKMVQKMKRVE